MLLHVCVCVYKVIFTVCVCVCAFSRHIASIHIINVYGVGAYI